MYQALAFLVLGFSVGVEASYYQQPEFMPLTPVRELSENTVFDLNAQSPQVVEAFSGLMDVSAIVDTRTEDTEHVGFGRVADSANMLGLSILIERREIPENTLIILDSGHSLPVATYMMREYFNEFNIQTILNFPSELNQRPGIRKRLKAHSRAWGQELVELQKRHAQKGPANVVILALEAHRKEYGPDYVTRLPESHLPSTEALRQLGIRQVLLMTEAHPDAGEDKIDRLLREDTRAYLESLDLPVRFVGNDCRREAQCWDIIGRPAPGGKFGIF